MLLSPFSLLPHLSSFVEFLEFPSSSEQGPLQTDMLSRFSNSRIRILQILAFLHQLNQSLPSLLNSSFSPKADSDFSTCPRNPSLS